MSLEVVKTSIETVGGKSRVKDRMEISDGRTRYFLTEKEGDPDSRCAILVRAMLNGAGGQIYYIDDPTSLEGVSPNRIPPAVFDENDVRDHVLPGETNPHHRIYEGGEPVFDLIIKAPSILS